MKRDDLMLLVLTFLTGLAIGMYIYLMAFKPIYAPASLSNEEDTASEWSLVAKKRGEYPEPSFRLLKNGEYTYITASDEDQREGKISGSLLRKLKEHDSDWALYNDPVERNNCPAINYNYRLVKDNVVYIIDTCETNLPSDSELAKTLETVWAQVEGRGSSSGGSFTDWAENWLQERIGVQE